MRFNEKEIVSVASEPGDKEGRIFYKGPGFRESNFNAFFKKCRIRHFCSNAKYIHKKSF